MICGFDVSYAQGAGHQQNRVGRVCAPSRPSLPFLPAPRAPYLHFSRSSRPGIDEIYPPPAPFPSREFSTRTRPVAVTNTRRDKPWATEPSLREKVAHFRLLRATDSFVQTWRHIRGERRLSSPRPGTGTLVARPALSAAVVMTADSPTTPRWRLLQGLLPPFLAASWASCLAAERNTGVSLARARTSATAESEHAAHHSRPVLHSPPSPSAPQPLSSPAPPLFWVRVTETDDGRIRSLEAVVSACRDDGAELTDGCGTAVASHKASPSPGQPVVLRNYRRLPKPRVTLPRSHSFM